MLAEESLTDAVLRQRDERILRTASRERRRNKERILALNATKNNDAMGLREPVEPIADPEPNTPFLWMTLTDQQKKKAVGKYFTQRELDSRQLGRERRRKERLQRIKEAKQRRRERYGDKGRPKKCKRKETNKRPGQNRVPLLRPITPVTIPESSPLIITEDSLSGATYGDNIENANGPQNGTRPNTTGTVQSDAVFEEFKALMEHAEAHDIHRRAQKFKEQFRGSNPYIKTRTKKVDKASTAIEPPLADLKRKNVWNRPFDPSQPRCRKCDADCRFLEKESVKECKECGALVNKMEWLHKRKTYLNGLNHAGSSTPKELLRPTFGEMVKKRLNARVRERFATDMGNICNYLGKQQKAGLPLGENIWKQFDIVQSRLRNNIRR